MHVMWINSSFVLLLLGVPVLLGGLVTGLNRLSRHLGWHFLALLVALVAAHFALIEGAG